MAGTNVSTLARSLVAAFIEKIDQLYMLTIVENLAATIIVWNKAASTDFVSSGRGPVYAEFAIEDA